MRSLFNGLLASSCALAVAVTGCSDRRLRPLTPCTTAGASNTVNIEDVSNVDLLFMVDNSGSMREEQAKLRDEFPIMVRALLTGDTNADGNKDWPVVKSLRIAVVTSDMGVAGLGYVAGTTGTRISTCGGTSQERAHYGDDGAFRLQGRSVVFSGTTQVDCDIDNDGTDDSVTAANLPSFLTFDNPSGGIPDPTAVDEYVRRVSCFTNTGTDGCSYEQQLESMLKALTPSTAAAVDSPLPNQTFSLPGGRFYYQTDDDPTAHAARGLGQGTDTNTTLEDMADTTANGGWLRSDSLLAVVLVTDEDDCSSKDIRVFDFMSTDPLYDDQYNQYQAATRCARLSQLTFSPDRYVQGLRALRPNNPNGLVFAAITGIPPELTDGLNASPGVVEGTDNINDIVTDPFMQYVYEDDYQPAGAGNQYIWVPNGRLRPACTHVEGTGTGASRVETKYDVTADTTDGTNSLTNVTITTPFPSSGTINATGTTASGTNSVTITSVAASSLEISAGMSIDGPGITPGTIIIQVRPDMTNPANLLAYLSEPATASASGVALTIGSTFGPAIGQQVESAGTEFPFGAFITNVTGTGPYTVTVSHRVNGTTTGLAATFSKLDVSATPGIRAAQVAQGLHNARVPVTVQSICVDSFGPAMGAILTQIQSNLGGSCLPRALNRNLTNKVNCDVFVTLPPNGSCASTPGMGTAPDSMVSTTDPADTDHQLERCRMAQVPVSGSDPGVADGGSPSASVGWFYDDFTSEVANCGNLTQRISFTTGATPPQGSVMKFSCIQPLQDGQLAKDINAFCADDTACRFNNDANYLEFRLRYNLEPRGWGDTEPTDVTSNLQLRCEPNSLTCQIPCTTDANCPGGFVCFDPRSLDPAATSYPYCANPTCGAGF